MTTIDRLLQEAYTNWHDAAVLSRTGQELHDRNRLDHARRVLRRALELDPSDRRAWAHLAYAHFRDFRAEEGLAILREGIERTGSDQLRAVLAAFTSDAEERTRLRESLANSREPAVRLDLCAQRFYEGEQEAYDEVRRILEAHPEDRDVCDLFCWTSLGAKQRLEEGLDLRETAVPVADRRIRERPGAIMGHWFKVQMLVAEQDWKAVLQATAEALQTFPDEETMLYFRGRAYRELDDPDRAIGCFHRAIGAKPSYVGARVELGKTYEAREAFDLAEEVFREIPEAHPGYPAGPMSLAFFYARRGRLEEAERIVLEHWPRLPEWMQKSLRSHPDAAALFERPAVRELAGEG